jgi:hypothetical protein
MPTGVEAEKTMPECRDTDRARLLGRAIGMKRVHAFDDRTQQLLGVELDSAVPGQPGRVLHLVRATGDGPTVAVIERRARGRGPDVDRDDH